ncbi:MULTISPECIES: Crp/Fnr family transcriptional regulator [unclassified Clostridioides]|uniref:Crp/Fnr family transcriptional regulator n=1 Tax=unclassified Clostridioides TaxID=2635829 RepID=UPI001D1084EB|nr:Crp/Fnr family transcriptional regulator [Clostridioides sp. ZZV14-6150]MCC0668606.1 Crp/Fnr family transcriptional regulator [Clostridioides sp. ZZV14-6153]MCC0717860.1 Crp/Fnr family transcriptional regulator [Clostridioides sp. ZZV14-6105]MCC0722054.1 Crp/Fnr family transcriptional regulator [Clostridioides sp. ZZV14-6104]MCC0725921.1 Crp/Fnr family transcriptional regulator [Clostridioides sp. ZZV14-6045]MCC0731993.1 Crp/Fnr family transcriptional regulator [Clostridioides sp. ZZV14-604
MSHINIESYFKDKLPFFNDLSESEVKDLISASYIQKYNKGELVHSKNSACTGIVVVLNGQLRSFMTSNSGKEITLFKLFERDICMLSSSCVYQDLTYDINLEAEKDSSVIIIDSKFFKEISSNNLSIQNFFLTLTQDKLSQIMWVLEQVVFFSLDSRVANFLIDQYYLNDSININITHDTIANNLGSAREAISRMLKRFENDKIVELSRGSIKIIDIEKLKFLSSP